MKSWQHMVALLLGLICLVMSIVLILFAKANQTLQTQLQNQQAEINRGNTSQQLGTNLIRDVANVAGRNDKMKALLAKHGLTLKQNAAATPAPAATEAPDSAPPPPTPTPTPSRRRQ